MRRFHTPLLSDLHLEDITIPKLIGATILMSVVVVGFLIRVAYIFVHDVLFGEPTMQSYIDDGKQAGVKHD